MSYSVVRKEAFDLSCGRMVPTHGYRKMVKALYNYEEVISQMKEIADKSIKMVRLYSGLNCWEFFMAQFRGEYKVRDSIEPATNFWGDVFNTYAPNSRHPSWWINKFDRNLCNTLSRASDGDDEYGYSNLRQLIRTGDEWHLDEGLVSFVNFYSSLDMRDYRTHVKEFLSF